MFYTIVSYTQVNGYFGGMHVLFELDFTGGKKELRILGEIITMDCRKYR